MIWWLRAKRASVTVQAGVIVLLLVVSVGSMLLPVPGQASRQAVAVPLALLLPLLLSSAGARSLASGEAMLESAAVRPVRRWNTILVTGLTILVATSVAVVALPTPELARGAARNCIGFVGLMLLGRTIVGSTAAPLVPAGFALICAVLGVDSSGQARWWAWPVEQRNYELAWSLAAGAFGFGALVTMLEEKLPAFFHDMQSSGR